MKLKKTGSWRNGETDENESPSWRTKAKRRMGRAAVRVFAVSYTHLDVYKRQILKIAETYGVQAAVIEQK